jgi:hypothetical protein
VAHNVAQKYSVMVITSRNIRFGAELVACIEAITTGDIIPDAEMASHLEVVTCRDRSGDCEEGWREVS